MPIIASKSKKNGLTRYEVRVNYTTPMGEYKRITRIAYGLQEAKDLERQLLREKELAPASTLRLSDLAKEYYNSKINENRKSTVDKARTQYRKHIEPYLGDVKLDKLSLPKLNNWKQKISEKNLSLITKQNIFTQLRAILNFGVKLDYLPKNNLVKLGNFKDSNYTKKKMLFYTADEFKQYIAQARKDALKNDFYDYYVFFSIAYLTGARKGEINALTWNDYYDNTIYITKSINQKQKGVKDVITPPKNKSSIRDIVVPDTLVKILEEHRSRLKATNSYDPNHFICGGMICLRDSSLTNKNKLFAEMAGIKKIRIHDFRHSHASLLANNNVNILEISRRLGHAKIDQTLNTYSHFYPQAESHANKVLEKTFSEFFGDFSEMKN